MEHAVFLILAGMIIIALSGSHTMSFGEEDTWTKKADMPTARYGLSTSVVDMKIYAIGGAIFGALPNGGQGPIPLPSVEEYNPVSDIWTKKAGMPNPRSHLSSSVVNGKIYAVGGLNMNINVALATVEEYDPKTDTWTKKADMPTPRSGLSTSAVNGRIYAIGGWSKVFAELSAVEEYDPETDTWTKKADMPTSRGGLSTSVVNSNIYVIGGGLPIVEEYDPGSDTWMNRKDMPTARTACTCVVSGKVYAIGGDNAANDYFPTVEIYDPATDTWTKKGDMPTARASHSASVVNGKIYVIGGLEVWEQPVIPLATVDECTPEDWRFSVCPQDKLATTWANVKSDGY